VTVGLASAPVAGIPLSLRERLRIAPTPSRLRAFMYATWALAAVLTVAGGTMLYGAWYAIKTVGRDTAPSIIAAQEISSALADLDANAGNYLLGTKQHQIDAVATFEKQRLVVTSSLVKAAQNITYGDSESVPINVMFDTLGRYLELFAEMKYQKDQGDEGRALATYTSATDLMHQRILPAASELDKANYGWLQYEYDRQQLRSEGAEVLAGILVAALVGLLAWAQYFLFRKTRRIVNPPLLVATLVTGLFGAYLVGTIATARDDLKVAKVDAFESIHAMWQARSVAYDANGDETRYLLGGGRAASFEQAYKDKVAKLTTKPQPTGSTFTFKDVPKDYKGFFGDEMRNITFDGERDAAVKMINAFAAYDKIDGRIRAFERASKHAEAVELCIGARDDQSNAAFDRFDKALQEVVRINRKEFDATVDAGQHVLVVTGTMLPIVSLVVAFLALFGIRVRLREYAA
jgi:hypothetical protein